MVTHTKLNSSVKLGLQDLASLTVQINRELHSGAEPQIPPRKSIPLLGLWNYGGRRLITWLEAAGWNGNEPTKEVFK